MNRYYYEALQEQRRRIKDKINLNISSYDLFIVWNGIECAMYPHLYPTNDFTDTGIMQHYKEMTLDNTNRVVSIGQSWTRKVLSEVRVYGEHEIWHSSCMRNTWRTNISPLRPAASVWVSLLM